MSSSENRLFSGVSISDLFAVFKRDESDEGKISLVPSYDLSKEIFEVNGKKYRPIGASCVQQNSRYWMWNLCDDDGESELAVVAPLQEVRDHNLHSKEFLQQKVFVDALIKLKLLPYCETKYFAYKKTFRFIRPAIKHESMLCMHEDRLPIKEMLLLFAQVIKKVQFLHENKLVYGNISSRTISAQLKHDGTYDIHFPNTTRMGVVGKRVEKRCYHEQKERRDYLAPELRIDCNSNVANVIRPEQDLFALGYMIQDYIDKKWASRYVSLKGRAVLQKLTSSDPTVRDASALDELVYELSSEPRDIIRKPVSVRGKCGFLDENKVDLSNLRGPSILIP